METKRIEITLTPKEASELYDLLHRIKDMYDRKNLYTNHLDVLVTIDERFNIFHTEALALDVLLTQIDNRI